MWVSLRLNVPPPNQGVLRRAWRNLRMMLVALVAPELTFGFAARHGKIKRVEGDPQSSADENSDARTLPCAESVVDCAEKRQNTEITDPPHRLTVGDRLNAALFGDYRHFDPMVPSTCLPSFWSIPFGEGPRELPLALLGQLICAILFGVVHCWAWNTSFPSVAEMWMWRGGASLIAGFPLLCLLLLRMSNQFAHNSVPRGVLTYLNYGLMALYIIARVVLLVLAFTVVRSLPLPTFADIEWTSIFPHL
ncbi:hypothetical protein GGX14DRAFT_400295 [Mycena pura]|uniref:Transmembrane protein n=1 Tax=Mycena pura TaxID=153505 RepID=A0AAD6V2H5_9AGAR|nr:hypothetical protein GGX14DRAFT_400295 [Mycena pura]